MLYLCIAEQEEVPRRGASSFLIVKVGPKTKQFVEPKMKKVGPRFFLVEPTRKFVEPRIFLGGFDSVGKGFGKYKSS